MRDFAMVLVGVALAAALGFGEQVVGGASGAEAPPSAAEVERIKELIKQLGDRKFEVREKAAAELPAFGRKALPFLEEAAKSADPEVANRAGDLAWELFWPFDAAEAGRRQKLAAEALGVPVEKSVDLGGGVKLELVLIPAGAFEMGSLEGEKDIRKWTSTRKNEGPVHKVRISKPFYLGKHEVTQEQWEKVMGKNPSHFEGTKNPVEQVSWGDCQEFLKKLNAVVPAPAPAGKEECAKGEFRLPAEAEWEYACRAGSIWQFCFGDSDDELGKYAWYGGNSDNKTHPVGEKRPNAWGLYDMHGNVLEWCQDWYGLYAGGDAQDDPIGPDKGSSRVYRGGSWTYFPDRCRSATRNPGSLSFRGNYLGLRLVLVVPAPVPR